MSFKKHALICLLPLCLALPAQGVETELKPLHFEKLSEWQLFSLPKVSIVTDTTASVAVWEEIDQALIKQISYNVARILYSDVADAPSLPTLQIILEDLNGVAYKEGDFSGAKIHISGQYLEKFASNNTPQSTYDELIGILYHEIAHAYQLDDHNYREIGPIIEGIADVVRMRAGYISETQRKAGGNYDTGYKTTAFFIDWLEHAKQPNLLVNLNAQLDPHDDIKWDWKVFAQRLNIDLEATWQSYQNSIN